MNVLAGSNTRTLYRALANAGLNRVPHGVFKDTVEVRNLLTVAKSNGSSIYNFVHGIWLREIGGELPTEVHCCHLYGSLTHHLPALRLWVNEQRASPTVSDGETVERLVGMMVTKLDELSTLQAVRDAYVLGQFDRYLVRWQARLVLDVK